MIVTVNKTSARATLSETPVNGRVGLTCTFVFSEDWAGLAKTVVFVGAETKSVALFGDTCPVPPEVFANAEHEHLRVGLIGRAADGTVVIPTVWAHVGEIKASAIDGGPESEWEPTPDTGAQIMAAISDLYSRIEGGGGSGGGGTEGGVSRAELDLLLAGKAPVFTTDATLTLNDGVLSVNTTDVAEPDNTLPITSAGVDTIVGNIDALLRTI